MKQEEVNLEVNVADDQLKELSSLAADLLKNDKAIEDLESALAALKQVQRQISEVDIPTKMKEMGMVSDEWSPDDHRQYWVLNKSLGSYEQSVTVSPDLAVTISSIINSFCDSSKKLIFVSRCFNCFYFIANYFVIIRSYFSFYTIGRTIFFVFLGPADSVPASYC